MSRILFRCDASLTAGSGHVMRCRTLARELQRRGATVTFLCRRQPGDLIHLLKQDFHVLTLPEQALVPCEGLEGRALYAAWLGCSQEEDAARCLEALASAGDSGAEWLVVDHYGLDAAWEDQLLTGLGSRATPPPPQLLVIDDLADRCHRCDLLLDQNHFGEATEDRYRGLVPPHCRQLLGPHYALLGPEYAQLHTLVPPRRELRRVLVFFGGVDALNLTSRALEALMAPELAHLAVDVVLGLQSPHRGAVAELVARRPHTTLHGPLPSLAGLIARADLGIGAGGVTTWERACLGLPSLVVSVAGNQRPTAEALHRAGHLRLLGEATSITHHQIREALLALSAEPFEAAAGHGLGDGWGTARLSTAMLGPQGAIRLHPATAADEALLLRWANEPQVRANSFSSEPISPDAHHQWFHAGLADANRLLLIATDAGGCPVGQIRFDRQPAADDPQTVEATIDLSLDRAVRGKGLAPELVSRGLEAMERQWGPAIDAVAEVLSTNTASNACFERAGFVGNPGAHPPLAASVTRWRWRPAVPAWSAAPAAG